MLSPEEAEPIPEVELPDWLKAVPAPAPEPCGLHPRRPQAAVEPPVESIPMNELPDWLKGWFIANSADGRKEPPNPHPRHRPCKERNPPSRRCKRNPSSHPIRDRRTLRRLRAMGSIFPIGSSPSFRENRPKRRPPRLHPLKPPDRFPIG